MRNWERKVLATPGAPERVAQLEAELRLAAGLAALREEAGLTQQQLAERMGIKQPRVAAIEKSRNVTMDLVERYVRAVGASLTVSVTKNGKTVILSESPPQPGVKRRPRGKKVA